jgi:hypothetical protein
LTKGGFTMKKILVAFLFLGAFFLVTLTSAHANIITTYADNYANWPGQITGDINSPLYKPNDEYGVPEIKSLTLTTDDDGYLLGISLNMKHWELDDALFINTGNSTWDSWDYYVYGTNYKTGKFSSVASDYTYSYATHGRTGHANGIATGLTPAIGLISYNWTGRTIVNGHEVWDVNGYHDLIYTFDGTIQLEKGFTIGYSPECANDVFLVPEPSQMLLLGMALVGLAGVGRRKFFKK